MIAEVTTAALMSEKASGQSLLDRQHAHLGQSGRSCQHGCHAARRLARMNTNLNVILGLSLSVRAGHRASCATLH